MGTSRLVRRVLLVLALLGGLAVIASVLLDLGLASAGEWSAVAASFAVITAVISAWTSQRSLEQQEDQLRPYPYPTIDVTSRPGVVQLRLTNFGATAAHKVRLDWDEQPETTRDGEPRGFLEGASVLHPDESIVEWIGGGPQTFSKYDNLEFTGTVHFEDPSGRSYSHRFRCSGEKYRDTSMYRSDRHELLHKSKGVPKDIEKIRKEIRKIRRLVKDAVD